MPPESAAAGSARGREAPLRREELLREFDRVRAGSAGLTRQLETEDMVVQSMPDASPTRWHLAHQSWFFDVMVLERQPQAGGAGRDAAAGDAPSRASAAADVAGRCAAGPDGPDYAYLFNSYYNTVGRQFPRPRRGLLTRPTVAQVMEYRAAVDRQVREFLPNAPEEKLQVLELGLHHEQQHQELVLTDLQHALAQNPLLPAAYPAPPEPAPPAPREPGWLALEGGVREIGHGGGCFAYDCERPRHQVLVRDMELADRPVTNAEYAEFIAAGGYAEARHWHSDGWGLVRDEGWKAPLYWLKDADGGKWSLFSLHGPVALQPQAPVANLSWYEASAYAAWRSEQDGQRLRLPTEAEWELCAAAHWPPARDWPGAQLGDPMPAQWLTPKGGDGGPGSVWEWTGSSFAPYPGFVPAEGALGEYNGKFMSGQMVLRGGSCLTPRGHTRASYRNFFPPQSRWQMSGLRLARDPG